MTMQSLSRSSCSSRLLSITSPQFRRREPGSCACQLVFSRASIYSSSHSIRQIKITPNVERKTAPTHHPTKQQRMNSTDQSTSYHPRILLGVTGSVAAVKAPELATKLVEHFRAHVKVLLTAGGENFWHKAAEYNPVAWERMEELLMENRTLLEKRSGIEVHYSREEWQGWNRIGDPVLHIDLRNWADHLLIAPLSAHTLAKIATGLCDDTLSCVVRAWDFGYRTATNGNTDSLDGKALLLAPAMNTAMWKHPLTQQQLQLVCSFGGDGCSYEDCIWNGSKGKGVMIIEPATKELACGEIGVGALAAVETIVCAVGEHLSQR